MSGQVEIGRGRGRLFSTSYPVTLPGLTDTEIMVRHGFAGGMTVYVDGLRAERGVRRGQFIVSQADGAQLEVTVRTESWGTAPLIDIRGETLPLGRSIEGAEWLWIGIPLLFALYLLVSNGGFGGIAIGGLAFYGNVRIFVDDGFTVRDRYLMSLASMGVVTAIGVAVVVVIIALFL
jgi:hypothetical protein